VPEVTFRPLRLEELPHLQAWLSEPHVSVWWGAPKTLAEVEAEYRPGIDGIEPTWHYIVSVDGRPIGMVQWYLWSSYPDEKEDGDIGVQPGEAGVDYFIGEPDMIGRGVGPLVIARFLDEIVFANNPDVTGVRTSIHAENRRSWRCLEKVGFVRGDAIPHPTGHSQYAPVLRRDQRSAAGHTSL
jgi:aminoglycoside 6'-N-acetyltransferase